MTLTGTLTRVTQDGAVNEYGDPTIQTTTETVPKLWLFETDGSEDTAADSWAYRHAEIWFPVGFVASHIDRIEVRGVAWEFFGDVIVRPNPRTGEDVYVEARAKATR